NNTEANNPENRAAGRRASVPAWLLSTFFHAALLIAVAMGLRMTQRTGVSAERRADVGIVLKARDGEHDRFVGPNEGENQSDQPDATADDANDGAEGVDLAEAFSQSSPADPGDVLPKARNALGLGALEGGRVGDAQSATEGPRGRGRPAGGGARVGVFGTIGEGFKFVYVFDCSGSMGGVGRSPLAAAKAELLASLESLDANHQFQIVFYNERPRQFNPSGQVGRLAFGTPRNKEFARRFVGSMVAEGATRHEEALMLAIRLNPDVIFFLTDADEPRLNSRQLAKIARRAGGITINAIEFGYGPQSDANNFLVRLARQNGGQHAYVDISRLRPAAKSGKEGGR
ncbi:MAG: hypothetical protein U9N87_10485, partial [Planctomycetota bacterium]|nr:hypothetical protein [Planctomycetota bacterium]